MLRVPTNCFHISFKSKTLYVQIYGERDSVFRGKVTFLVHHSSSQINNVFMWHHPSRTPPISGLSAFFVVVF